MSGMKFTLSDVTSFLLDNLFAHKNIYICTQACGCMIIENPYFCIFYAVIWQYMKQYSPKKIKLKPTSTSDD